MKMVEQSSQKYQQYFCAIIASTGALIFGSLVAWTAPSLQFLKSNNYSAPFLLNNKHEGEIIAALLPFGALLGSLLAGLLADLCGRKLILTIFAIPLIISWVLTTFATTVSMLYVARFMAGLVGGLFCGILPMYINEIADNSTRGVLVTFFYIFISLGQLQVQILAIFDSYTILCYYCTALSIALFIGFLFIPESPFYLVKKERSVEAVKVLNRLRGPHCDVSMEIKDINDQLQNQGSLKTSWTSMFTKVRLKSLIICSGLMIFQQLSGVSAVIFFSNMIFKEARVSSPVICSIIFSSFQSLATIAFGFFIEKISRKIWLLMSVGCMGLSLLVLGYYFWMLDRKMDTSKLTWLPLCSIVFFIVIFKMGIGPIPWLMSVELLDPEIKSLGATVTAATNLAGTTLVTLFFESLVDLISAAYTFWMFAGGCLLGVIFILVVVPETKGKSVQEMQLIMAGRN